MSRRHASQALFEGEPHRNREDSNVFAGQTGHKQLPPVMGLDEGAEGVWDLEPAFVIDLRRVGAPEHGFRST